MDIQVANLKLFKLVVEDDFGGKIEFYFNMN